MVITPNSKIILLKSPLKLDNYNQITFSNVTAQFNYFNGLTKLECEDATYVRKDNVVRFPTHTEINDNLPTFENLLEYNYCMYQNTSYDSKWFYAFITDVKYINDGMCEITLETDTFQSWQFEINYMNSYIEREHVSDDTIGLHTLPENLETGEYIVNAINKNNTLLQNSILVASTIDLSTYTADGGETYGGVYQGYTLYAFSNTSAGRLALQNILRQMNQDQRLDAIVGIFICNFKFYSTDTTSEGSKVTASTSPVGFTWGRDGNVNDSPISKLTTLDGYTPKNNKLKTFPFMYLLLDNGNGSQAIYRYEDFKSSLYPNTCEFDIVGTPSFGGSFFATPQNYGGNTTDNFKNRLHGGKLPTCGFQNDTFTNWITANAVPLTTGLIEDSISAVSSVLEIGKGNTGGGIRSLASGFGGIANTINQVEQHSKMPPQHIGNADSGDVNFSSNLTTFTAYSMSIKSEYAQCIDQYFEMFGYKVNKLAIPNIHKRSNWDFIKCIDVNLEGNIPEKDLDKIRTLFNNGCTFWHTTEYYLDYSKTNSIL